jgi:hypothetical protein
MIRPQSNQIQTPLGNFRTSLCHSGANPNEPGKSKEGVQRDDRFVSGQWKSAMTLLQRDVRRESTMIAGS